MEQHDSHVLAWYLAQHDWHCLTRLLHLRIERDARRTKRYAGQPERDPDD